QVPYVVQVSNQYRSMAIAASSDISWPFRKASRAASAPGFFALMTNSALVSSGFMRTETLESGGLHPRLAFGEAPGLHDPALHHGDEPLAVFEQRNVCDDVAVDDQHIRQFARFEGPQLVAAPHDLSPRLRRAGDRFERREPDVLDEERQLAGV